MTLTAEESLLKGLIALKEARHARGLSLSEVSRQTGIDLASLSRLEGGKNPNPTVETLSRYAQALGFRLELSLVENDVPISSMKKGKLASRDETGTKIRLSPVSRSRPHFSQRSSFGIGGTPFHLNGDSEVNAN